MVFAKITTNKTNINNTIINDNNNEKSLPKGKWLLIYYANTQCDEECLHDIYLMRQVNTALGKNMDRLQRLFLSKIPPNII